MKHFFPLLLLALGLAAPRLQAQPGTLDATFNTANNGQNINGLVHRVAVQPDNKIIIAGSFTTVYGTARAGLARLNADGTLDASFSPGTGFGSTLNDIFAITLQPDGKILVGGRFTTFNGVSRGNILRLNPDGSFDNSFNMGTGFSGQVNCIVVQADGNIMVGGGFVTYNGTRRVNRARLLANGTLDPSFAPGTTQEPNGGIFSLVPLASGQYLMGGDFSCVGSCSVPSNNRSKLARLNADGSNDPTFAPAGTSFNSRVYRLAVQPDGKILAGGSFNTYNGTTIRGLARLNPDGSLDTGFAGSSTFLDVQGLKLLPNGQILITGAFSQYNGVNRKQAALLTAAGTLDTSFGLTDGLDNAITGFDLQRDGRVVVGGSFQRYYPPTGASTRVNYLARLNGSSVLTTRPATAAPGLQVYAGAAPGLFEVAAALPLARLLVTDALGRPVASPAAPAACTTLDLRAQPAGVYFVRALGAGAASAVRRVVVP